MSHFAWLVLRYVYSRLASLAMVMTRGWFIMMRKSMPNQRWSAKIGWTKKESKLGRVETNTKALAYDFTWPMHAGERERKQINENKYTKRITRKTGVRKLLADWVTDVSTNATYLRTQTPDLVVQLITRWHADVRGTGFYPRPMKSVTFGR